MPGASATSALAVRVEEVDGSPSAVCQKLVFPNGSVSISSGVATITPATPRIVLGAVSTATLTTAGAFIAFNGVNAAPASHAAAGFLLPIACTLKLAYLTMDVAVEASDTVTLEIFKNGVTTGITVSVATGQTSGTASGSVAFAAGDYISAFLDTAPTAQAAGNVYRMAVSLEI